MKIVFAGVIAREPLGGPTWVWLQYLLGFRRLGHEVYFLEESGDWPYVYDFETMESSDDLTRGAAYIEQFLAPFGLGDRWIYRAGERCLGMASSDVLALCNEADLLITLPTSLWAWREEYDAVRARVFLDVDPGFTQLRAAQGDYLICQTLEHCTHFLTYGPGIADGTSPIPRLGLAWQATVPPVVLEEWPLWDGTPGERFTTLMQWSHDPSPELEGEIYGQKNGEFERILDLPRHTAQPLEVALSGGPEERLRAAGWHVVPGWQVSRDPDSYRRYIQAARGELSVAKHGYVKTGCGWISDRTVCFLASGKPALVQETGLSRWLPTGEGLLTFRDHDEALKGLDSINNSYEHHHHVARKLVEEYFASGKVLSRILNQVG